MGVERPSQVERKARGEEERDGLELGVSELARAWTRREGGSLWRPLDASPGLWVTLA